LRLRKLLGSNEAVLQQGGKVSLDRCAGSMHGASKSARLN